MARRAILGLVVLSAAFLLGSCTQAEGERCQRDKDCEPLMCVGADGLGGDGHCCPRCDRGTEQWRFVESADGEGGSWQCACSGSTSSDGDADADQEADGGTDADQVADTDVPGDAERDGDEEADGDHDGDTDRG